MGISRLGVGQNGLGLFHVPFRGGAALKPRLGDLQAFGLDAHVFVGDGQAFFQGADEDVAVGHIGGEADQDIVIIGDGRLEAGIGGLDGPAKFAPEIQFPTGGQADLGLSRYCNCGLPIA